MFATLANGPRPLTNGATKLAKRPKDTHLVTEREKYNLCLQSFVDHHYAVAWALGNELAAKGTLFPIYMTVILSAQHLNRIDLATDFGGKVLQSARQLPWEEALVRFVLQMFEPQQTLALAETDDRRCQAHYYIGARRLVESDRAGARESFEACLRFESRCVEYALAELELKHFDKTEPKSEKRDDEPRTQIWEFGALLEMLKSQHGSNYVYRGQNRHYCSLLTSGYRNIVDMTYPPVTDLRSASSLYSRGRVFRPLLPNSLWPEAGRKRIDFVSLCRAQFGYLVSQLFCQHCCLPSEGLDVSDDFEVAAFFAIFDYGHDMYVEEATSPGAIYRITVGEHQALSLGQLKETDYYSCPFFVRGADVFNLLGRCGTETSSNRSFGAYFEQKLNLELTLENPDDIRRQRPLELIEFPESEVRNGRVMKQSAGLVFPDVVLPRAFEQYSFPPPRGKTWDGPQCVEDLAQSPVVEAFFFRHDAMNSRRLNRDPHGIFPRADPLRRLLSNLISAISAGNFMTPTLAIQDTSVFGIGDEKELPR